MPAVFLIFFDYFLGLFLAQDSAQERDLKRASGQQFGQDSGVVASVGVEWGGEAFMSTTLSPWKAARWTFFTVVRGCVVRGA